MTLQLNPECDLVMDIYYSSEGQEQTDQDVDKGEATSEILETSSEQDPVNNFVIH